LKPISARAAREKKGTRVNKIAVNVLYAEDDDAEIELARISVEDACPDVDFHFHVVHDGESVVNLLSGNGEFRPDFAILDLNLPRMKGDEVLAAIRANDKWKNLPVVILSGVVPPSTREELARLNVDLLLDKALDLSGYRAVFRRIADFWKKRAT
jgi:CheY-like chemotaxis protein